MKLLYSCRYFSIILSLLQFTDTFFHHLLYVHYQEVSHVSTLHLFRHNLSGFTSQTHLILYLRHTDHSPCLKYSVCFCCTAFLTETSSVISHLQEQDVISHQWLNQLLENSSIQIYLFENGTPLFYDQYHQTTADEQLCENALLAAEELTGNPPFFTKNKRLSSHTEYQFNSGAVVKNYRDHCKYCRIFTAVSLFPLLHPKNVRTSRNCTEKADTIHRLRLPRATHPISGCPLRLGIR